MAATLLRWRTCIAICTLSVCFTIFGAASEDESDLAFLKDAPSQDIAIADLLRYVESGGTISSAAGREVVEIAMERSWWDLTTRVVKQADESFGVDLSSAVHQMGSRIRSKLQTLADGLAKTAHSAGIPPAFEWAQSPDSVLLNLKFAHKIDTPATLGCEVFPNAVEITPFSLRLRAECKEKHKAFDLMLGLHSEIDPVASTWAPSAVGRALVTLRKVVNATWPRLLKEDKKPAQMHVWWAMRERYEAENEAFDKKQKEKAAAAKVKVATTQLNVSEPPSTQDATLPSLDVAADPIAAADADATADAATTPVAAARPSAESPGMRLQRQAERELRAVDMAERTELQAIDMELRAAKMAADTACRAEKSKLDADADSRRNVVRAAKATERAAINASRGMGALPDAITRLLPTDLNMSTGTGSDADSGQQEL